MDRTQGAKNVGLSLPKLVLKADFTKVVALAASGDIKQLKAAIDSSIARSQAALHPFTTAAQSKDDPPPIALCMPVVQATWAGHASVVGYFVTSFSDVVEKEGETSFHPKPFAHCCEVTPNNHTHRHGPYLASHVAACLGNEDILHLWGDSCVCWRDDLGRTPLHWAAFFCRESIVRYLLSVGAPVNATNNMGVTPLVDCLEALKNRSEAVLETFILLLENGAEVGHSCSSVGTEIAITVWKYLSIDELSMLLAFLVQAKDEAMVSIGKFFQLVCSGIHAEPADKSDPSPVNSFCDYLLLVALFSGDLDQVRASWECALSVRADHGANVSFLPPIEVYENRKEVSSWEEAELILSQTQLTSNLTEVLYQYGIMVERVLGSDNPYLIELLCNTCTRTSITLGLEHAHPSKAVEHIFSRGIELLKLFLTSGKQESYSFHLESPVGYFDMLVEKSIVPNYAVPLKLLIDTLVIMRKTKIFPSENNCELENVCKCIIFFTFMALNMLCRMAYIAHKERGTSSVTLPHEIDEFGQRLLQMSSPVFCYFAFFSKMPSWLKDKTEELDYVEFIVECFKSWAVRSGSLYALDLDGKMAIDHVIEDVFEDENFLHQPLLHLMLEHGSHPDAVNGSNSTPYETLQAQRLTCSDSIRWATSTVLYLNGAITKPCVTPPLSCLAARAVVKYRFPYRTAEHIPTNVVTFISMHDRNRPRDLFLCRDYWDPDVMEDDSNALLKVEFSVPL